MHECAAPEHQLSGSQAHLTEPGCHTAADQCRSIGQGKILLHLEGLLPGGFGIQHRIPFFQQLHILRQLSGHRYHGSFLPEGLRLGTDSAAKHHFPGRNTSGIQKAHQPPDPQFSIPAALVQIPLHLKGDPGFHGPKIASVLRCVEHMGHNAPIAPHRVSPPFLSPDNYLPPGAQDPADIRHTIRKPQLLGLFLGLDLPQQGF